MNVKIGYYLYQTRMIHHTPVLYTFVRISLHDAADAAYAFTQELALNKRGKKGRQNVICLGMAAILLFVVLYCGFDCILSKHGAVELDWRQLQVRRDVSVLDCSALLN